MGEFKVGEVVRHACSFGYAAPGEGTVERRDRFGVYYLKDVTCDDGEPLGFRDHELAPVAATPADAYHDKKHDKGKDDYTLLPAKAVAALLKYEVDTADTFEEAEEAHDAYPGAIASMFEYWSKRNEPWPYSSVSLGNAYLSACESVSVSLPGVVKVLAYGAAKYSRDSWQAVPDATPRYFSAAMRHLTALMNVESHDEESGLPHLDHFLCNVLFLISLESGYVKPAQVSK